MLRKFVKLTITKSLSKQHFSDDCRDVFPKFGGIYPVPLMFQDRKRIIRYVKRFISA